MRGHELRVTTSYVSVDYDSCARCAGYRARCDEAFFALAEDPDDGAHVTPIAMWTTGLRDGYTILDSQ
eukprot:SAG11_NODE_2981_length_2794_cov_1.858256_4_plen_68_part_00